MIAVAAEREEGTEEDLGIALRKAATDGVKSGRFKPRCALCGAPYDTFEVEIGRSTFATLEEAAPQMRAAEAAQRRLTELCESMKWTYEEIKDRERKAKAARNN